MENHQLFKIDQNAIIQDKSGKILILKKDGKWMLPGGRLEQNETWLEGLRREVREETGIKDLSIEKIINVDMSDSGKTYIVTFLCGIKDASEIKLSDEHQEYAWLNFEEIDSYEFWHPSIKERILKVR